jgi:hypothetical protein
MSELTISEAGSVQFPMVAHAAATGWIAILTFDGKPPADLHVRPPRQDARSWTMACDPIDHSDKI